MPNENNQQAPATTAKAQTSVWDNKIFRILLALSCGIITWLIVAMFIDSNATHFITNASINWTNSSSTYTAQGLDIVERPDIENVTVRVDGDGTVIGNMTSADIMVYPSYTGVTGPGETTLRLQARVTNTSEFSGDIKLTVENPTTVDVVFDEVSEKVVPVTVDATLVEVEAGYSLNRTTAVPAEVTLRGPTTELDQIESVVAPVTETETLADTTTLPAMLEMRDEDGAVFEPQYTTMDSESVNVTLTVYQVRELPLVIDFIGTPVSFDTGTLKYTLSQQTLRVAGPTRTVSALEALTVSNFDLAREFEVGRDYQRLVELPAGLVSQDGISTVTLNFDTSNMDSTTLNVSNIRAINVPSNYDIEVLSSLVNGVMLYGPTEEIGELSADSIVAQIDCQSLNLTVGQQTVPVTIQIPSSSRIFATGSYSVQCQVTAK